jgi:prepilin-type N-terminal cleavage/methylation domain-containing protein
MARCPAHLNERGFTLAELLVACAVLGIVMAGVLGIQQQGLGAYQVGAARVEVQQNSRAALETMLNELRVAERVTAAPAGCGTGPVPTGGGATTISIEIPDVEPPVGAAIPIQYQLVGTDLQRNGDVLVGGVESLRIWCYDAAGALTATPTLVRSVHVQIRTRTEAPVTATSPRNQRSMLETRVRLRNP